MEIDSMDLADYEYIPLEPDQIRVLHLQTGSFDDPLVGTLIHQPPNRPSDRQYHAISYAWGPAIFSESIQLDGKILRITETLYSALKGLRFSSDDTQSYSALWADAICIDQSNTDERNVQVAIMASIFRNAAGVHVWLGDKTESDELAFWMITCICEFDFKSFISEDKVIRHSFMQHLREWVRFQGHEILYQIVTLRLQRIRDIEIECFRAISLLSKRAWFHRLWVVQEVAFADPDNVTIWLGDRPVHYNDWNYFVWASNDLCQLWMDTSTLSDRTNIEAAKIFWRTQKLSDLRDDDPEAHPAERLIYLLTDAYELGASDKRDLIYATREIIFSGPTQEIVPDYSKPPSQLWLDVTMFMLNAIRERSLTKHEAVLGVLALPAIQSQHRSPDLPSWVPDLSILDYRCSNKLLSYRRHDRSLSAGGSANCLFSFSTDCKTIYTHGHIVAIIDARIEGSARPLLVLHDAPGSDKGLVDYFDSIIEWRKTCAYHLDESGSIASFLVQGSSAHLSGYNPVVDVNKLLNFHIASNKQGLKDTALSAAGRNQLLSDIGPFFCEELYTRHLDNTWILAKTSDDKVGWVPQNAQLGDCVAVIRGAPFAFILRRVDDEHCTMVGDAYIHGIMQGEACQHNDDDWVTLAIK